MPVITSYCCSVPAPDPLMKSAGALTTTSSPAQPIIAIIRYNDFFFQGHFSTMVWPNDFKSLSGSSWKKSSNLSIALIWVTNFSVNLVLPVYTSEYAAWDMPNLAPIYSWLYSSLSRRARNFSLNSCCFIKRLHFIYQ